MNILAIDTSSTACSVALLVNDKIHLSHRIVPMEQAKLILPTIEEVLATAQLTLNQLEALAFGCGPGSFTGVRIATSVIQALGFATQLPVIQVSSLAALAQSAFDDLGWKKLLVGVDARIQEVYWAAYEVNAKGLVELSGEERVCKPEDVLFPPEANWYGVGNAWLVYRDSLTYEPLALDNTRLPTASAILQLAKDKYLKNEWISLEEALPVYLRDSVAIKEKNR